MGTSRQLFKVKGTACSLACGLLLAGLISGCTEPFVKVAVQVDTCQAGGMGKPIDELSPPGLCNVMTYSGSAVGFIDDNNGGVIPPGSPLSCSASYKCKALPGTCVSGVACKSHRATNGSCYCGC